MRVAELGAGGGYTTELLARVVGPTGHVYGQNSPFVLERFAEKPWSARLAKPVMQTSCASTASSTIRSRRKRAISTPC